MQGESLAVMREFIALVTVTITEDYSIPLGSLRLSLLFDTFWPFSLFYVLCCVVGFSGLPLPEGPQLWQFRR